MTGRELPEASAARARELLRLLARVGRRSASDAAEVSYTEAEKAVLEFARRRGFIEAAPAAGGVRISRAGREFLRRTMSGQDIAEAGAATATAPVINPEESPLGWLRRHKGRDGMPFLRDEEFDAGERLRADFWFAGMTPRVTSSWSVCGLGGGRRAVPGAGVEIRDQAVAAETRVRRALEAVGPELAGILIDVCCHLKGIEDVERQADWPQRAGKVVLRVALAALARHYGLGAPGHGERGRVPRQAIRHWGAADYKPRIDDRTE